MKTSRKEIEQNSKTRKSSSSYKNYSFEKEGLFFETSCVGVMVTNYSESFKCDLKISETGALGEAFTKKDFVNKVYDYLNSFK